MNELEKNDLIKKVNKSPQSKLIWKILRNLKSLKDSGMKPEEIDEVIQKMNLPFGLHMAITGRFSDFMELF